MYLRRKCCLPDFLPQIAAFQVKDTVWNGIFIFFLKLVSDPRIEIRQSGDRTRNDKVILTVELLCPDVIGLHVLQLSRCGNFTYHFNFFSYGIDKMEFYIRK